MKTLKKTLAVLSAAAMLCGASVPVSAGSIIPEDPEAIMMAKAEDCTNSCKAYDIKDMTICEFAHRGIGDGRSFSDIFADTSKVYGWFDNGRDHAVITFWDKNGRTEFLGATIMAGDTAFPDINEIARQITEAQDGKVTDMKIGKSKMAKSYIIYFKTDDNEYVTPVFDVEWSEAPECSVGVYKYIENRKTYTLNDFLETIGRFCGKYDGFLMGDVNNDSKVNVRDCSALANAMAGKNLDVHTAAWDYNMDEKINVRDCADLAADLAKK